MDNNNIDFKNIWQQQTVSQPNIDALLSKLKAFKQSNLKKMILVNVLLIGVVFFVAFIWIYFKPQFITTKIGMILAILAMVIHLFAYNKLFANFKQIDSTQNNKAYLQSLCKLKDKQKFMQTTMLSLYFALLSTGILLYTYEYASLMPKTWFILTYSVTIAWFAFNWFYLRPKVIKKEQAKVDELISKFESVIEQTEEG